MFNLDGISNATLTDLELMTYSDTAFAANTTREIAETNFQNVQAEMRKRNIPTRTNEQLNNYLTNVNDGFNPWHYQGKEH